MGQAATEEVSEVGRLDSLLIPAAAEAEDNVRVDGPAATQAPKDPNKNCMRCGRFLRRDADRCDECGRKLCDRCLQLDCEEFHRGYGPLPDEELEGARREPMPTSPPRSRRPPGWYNHSVPCSRPRPVPRRGGAPLFFVFLSRRRPSCLGSPATARDHSAETCRLSVLASVSQPLAASAFSAGVRVFGL